MNTIDYNPFQKMLDHMREDRLNRKFWNECYNPDFTRKYLIRKGFRGSGRVYEYVRRYGYDLLVIQGIRIKLRYPLGCPDVDAVLSKIMLVRLYGDMYYFTDHFDRNAVTFRK